MGYISAPSQVRKAMAFCCNFCEQPREDMQVCSKCRAAPYCGRQCQLSDWKEYGNICSYRAFLASWNAGLMSMAVWKEYANIPTHLKKSLGSSAAQATAFFYRHPTLQLLEMHFETMPRSVAVLVFSSLTALLTDMRLGIITRVFGPRAKNRDGQLEVYTVEEFDAQVAPSAAIAGGWDRLPHLRPVGFAATRLDNGKLFIWAKGRIDLDG